jgi:hypothetical protein
MKKDLKLYKNIHYYRGVEVKRMAVCASAREAGAVFGISAYQVKKYSFIDDVPEELAHLDADKEYWSLTNFSKIKDRSLVGKIDEAKNISVLIDKDLSNGK